MTPVKGQAPRGFWGRGGGGGEKKTLNLSPGSERRSSKLAGVSAPKKKTDAAETKALIWPLSGRGNLVEARRPPGPDHKGPSEITIADLWKCSGWCWTGRRGGKTPVTFVQRDSRAHAESSGGFAFCAVLRARLWRFRFALGFFFCFFVDSPLK